MLQVAEVNEARTRKGVKDRNRVTNHNLVLVPCKAVCNQGSISGYKFHWLFNTGSDRERLYLIPRAL